MTFLPHGSWIKVIVLLTETSFTVELNSVDGMGGAERFLI
jgi:hypothetical protein